MGRLLEGNRFKTIETSIVPRFRLSDSFDSRHSKRGNVDSSTSTVARFRMSDSFDHRHFRRGTIEICAFSAVGRLPEAKCFKTTATSTVAHFRVEYPTISTVDIISDYFRRGNFDSSTFLSVRQYDNKHLRRRRVNCCTF